jgi:predicted ATP-binding protein involved in virulence
MFGFTGVFGAVTFYTLRPKWQVLVKQYLMSAYVQLHFLCFLHDDKIAKVVVCASLNSNL